MTGERRRTPTSRPSRTVTWLELAVANGGFRTAVTALTWAYSWCVVQEATGGFPSAESVAAWWRRPVRTAYREQAAFRRAFPTLETPSAMYQNPELRRRLAEAVRVAAALDAQGEVRTVSEDAVLQLGLQAATI